MNKSSRSLLFYATFLLFFISTTTHANTISLSASIDGAQADAGNGTGSPGTGSAEMNLDDMTHEFNWKIEWSGLTSPVTVAHFHGPAAPNENAGIQVPFDVGSNPSMGSAVLSQDQQADLLAGLWYINIHSENYPAGEIRGQVQVVPIPGAIWLLSSGLIVMFGYSRRNKTTV